MVCMSQDMPSKMPQQAWLKTATEHLAKQTIKYSVLAKHPVMRNDHIKIGVDLLLSHFVHLYQSQPCCQKHWAWDSACCAEKLSALMASACSLNMAHPDQTWLAHTEQQLGSHGQSLVPELWPQACLMGHAPSGGTSMSWPVSTAAVQAKQAGAALLVPAQPASWLKDLPGSLVAGDQYTPACS